MPQVQGLVGLRPAPEQVAKVSSPPYDVIKEGTPLHARLSSEPASLFHVILGEEPAAALDRLRAEGRLVEDEEPAFYVYEQRFSVGAGPDAGVARRLGVFVAAAVSPYEEGQIIRHEKTFDEKVKGRIALREATGFSFGPVFTLTRAPIGALLERAMEEPALYEFTSELGPGTDLDGIESRIVRVPERSSVGEQLKAALSTQPLYIADGHHRYHASLRNEQTHFLCYVAEHAAILAYDRVVNGAVPFAEAKGALDLAPAGSFETPAKHRFRLYSKEGCFELAAKEVPEDAVGRLDCAILERELYPALGLDRSMIKDPAHFDYHPESALEEMKAAVDRGDYELAIALHPVSLEELYAVADAGLADSEIVMPQKSTFFAPKILSGLFIYRHEKK